MPGTFKCFSLNLKRLASIPFAKTAKMLFPSMPTLILILLFIFTSIVNCQRRVIIGEQNGVTRGDWGGWQSCGLGKYAVGFILKLQSPAFFRDNTGVNGVALLCKDMKSSYNNENIVIITSLVGDLGDWMEGFYCPGGGHLNGFQLETGFYWRESDQMAVTNMNGICTSGHDIGQDVIRHKLLKGNGLGKSYGSLSKEFLCEPGYAICAIQTQVESWKYFVDDSGLNDVRVKCCPISHQTSGPMDEWQLIAECNNAEGDTPKTCDYKKQIGILTGRTDESEWIRVMAQVRHLCIEVERSEITGYNWLLDTENSRVKDVESSLHALPGQITEMYQVVGTYTDVKIRTKMFKKIEIGGSVNMEAAGTGVLQQQLTVEFFKALVVVGVFVAMWRTCSGFVNNFVARREPRRRRNEIEHVPRAVPLAAYDTPLRIFQNR